jgi:hypothetical protein
MTQHPLRRRVAMELPPGALRRPPALGAPHAQAPPGVHHQGRQPGEPRRSLASLTFECETMAMLTSCPWCSSLPTHVSMLDKSTVIPPCPFPVAPLRSFLGWQRSHGPYAAPEMWGQADEVTVEMRQAGECLLRGVDFDQGE